MHEEIYIYLHPLPEGIREAVTVCNGGYNIVIDPRQSTDGMMRSLSHAMRHISNSDFDRDSTQLIENEAHKKTAP